MLISFSAENYRSFGPEQTLSLEATKDDAHPDHVVDCGRFSLLKTAAIYGANASGKSNLLKAFKFMREFVKISATRMNLGDTIHGADIFRLDKTLAEKPCSFDIRVLLNDVEYQYGFSTTKERVHDEWLYVTRKGTRTTNPLSRCFDPSTGKTDWTLRGELKNKKDVAERTRDNGLFLSRAAEMNVDCVKGLFSWFVHHYRYLSQVLSFSGLMQRLIRYLRDNEDFRVRIAKLIHDADFGITGLSIEPDSVVRTWRQKSIIHIQQSLFDPEDFDPEELPVDSQKEKVENFYKIKTYHRLPNSKKSVAFSLEDDESNGTQRFLAILSPIFDAIDNGSLLVVDELDCSMHPHLTYKLVEMFQSAEMNPKGAQLIFATHDTNLMTPALFRRDEIWLTEKNAQGTTELFSLADIKPGDNKSKPRKDEAFEKNYLAGRYGGVPSFGPALENF